MKFKNLGALFLLSLAAVYFICPVQCAAIQGTGEDTASDKVRRHQQHQIGSQNVAETSQSACCQSENQPTSRHEDHGAEEGHCCFNQWESLGASEPQLASQIQKDTFAFVVLIPTTPKNSSCSISFIPHFQHSYNLYTDPPRSQLSSRAPPFSLA